MTPKPKSIRVELPDDMYAELKAMCTHRGELSYLVRRGIALIIDLRKQETKGTDDK